jgi:hypothetical protein
MNFKKWLLSEMPITRFDLQGNWGPNNKSGNGFDKKSIGILTNPKAVEKIHRKWSNTKENFELYFVRQVGASKFNEMGEVSKEWVKENLGMDIQPAEDTITIIYTNNIGANKVPMTAWGIAHRMAHTIARLNRDFNDHFTREVTRFFNEITLKLNGKFKEKIQPIHVAQAVGTMKSARDFNLGNFGEFIFELVAQYVITGHIKFNPLTKRIITSLVPRKRPTTVFAYITDEELAEINNDLEMKIDVLEYNIESIFGACVNKIFVM